MSPKPEPIVAQAAVEQVARDRDRPAAVDEGEAVVGLDDVDVDRLEPVHRQRQRDPVDALGDLPGALGGPVLAGVGRDGVRGGGVRGRGHRRGPYGARRSGKPRSRVGCWMPPSISISLPVTYCPALRDEVEHGGGDVLRLADPTERRLALELAHQLGLAGDELQRAGHDRADVDAVDPDPRREVLGGHLGPVRERGLGGAVGDEAAVGRAAHHRADRDDALLPAVGVLQHQRHGGAGQRVRGGDVEAERLVEEARCWS